MKTTKTYLILIFLLCAVNMYTTAQSYKETKDADIIDTALLKARLTKPQTLNLIDKNLAPAAYEKLVEKVDGTFST